jgi:hypothetical protein
MNPMKSLEIQVSSGHKIMIIIGILTMFVFVLMCYASLDPKASPDLKFGALSLAMILLMFGFWFIIPSCFFFYRKRYRPGFTNLSDLEIDKLMTPLFGISVICIGIGTIFSYFVRIEDFVTMLVIFSVISLFLFLQIKFRNKRRMNMTE